MSGLKFIQSSDCPPFYLVKMPDNDRRFAVLYREMDGFYVFALERGAGNGFFEEWILRQVADKLKELNADWQRQIDEHFSRLLAADMEFAARQMAGFE